MLNKKIKGITIEIGGNVQPLNKALESTNKHSRDLQSELKQVDRLLKLDPTNIELIAQKQKLLGDAVSTTKEKLDTLKEAEKQVQEQFARGEVGEGQYRALQREIIQTEQDLKKFEKQLGEVNNKWEQFGQKSVEASKALMPVAAVIIAATAGAAYAGMELEATQAKYETVFDGMTDRADQFLKDFRRLTPATIAEARSMASGIQDLLVPMGYARDMATDMTGEFIHVIGALANFNSGTHTATDVAKAMQSAITGEYQSLKTLGIQLDATTVKQKAVEMGLVSSTGEVTKQMAAQVLLAEVYAQSGDALAAYNEEQLDAKTKMQLFLKDVQSLASRFGEVLLPVLHKIFDAGRAFIDRFGEMGEGTRQFILIVALAVTALIFLVGIIGYAVIWLGRLVTAYKALTAAQWLLNVAQYANPILFVIGLIIILIGAASLLTKWIEKWRGENDKLGESLINLVWLLLTGPIGAMVLLFRHFKNFKAALARELNDLIELINWVIEGINRVTRSKIELIPLRVVGTGWGVDIDGKDKKGGFFDEFDFSGVIGDMGKISREIGDKLGIPEDDSGEMDDYYKRFEEMEKYFDDLTNSLSDLNSTMEDISSDNGVRVHHDISGVIELRGVTDEGQVIAAQPLVITEMQDHLRIETRQASGRR